MKISLFAKNPPAAGCASAALLAGCATGPKLDYTDYAGEPVKSFYMNNFDGWNSVSKDQLVVWTGLNKAYLLTITGDCPDLQYANAIAVTSTGTPSTNSRRSSSGGIVASSKRSVRSTPSR